MLQLVAWANSASAARALDVGTSKAHLVVMVNHANEGPHGGAERKAAEGALQRAAVDAK